MKKITAIILSLSLCIILMPFSVIEAATNVTAYSSGQFNNGYWSTYYGVNSNGYVVLQEFGLIQNVQQFESVLVTKVDLDDYYSGVLDIELYGNSTTNLWEYYVEGEGAYISGSNTTHIQITLVNCQQFYLVGLCGNDNDTVLRPKSIDSSGIYIAQLLNSNTTNYITNMQFLVYYASSSYNSYTTNILDKNYYYVENLSISDLYRLYINFTLNSIKDANYLVFTFYVLANDNRDISYFDDLHILARDHTNTNFYIDDYVYHQYFHSHINSTNKDVYLFTFYVPLSLMTNSPSGGRDWKFSTYFYHINNVEQCGFIYRGLIENLPSELLGNNVTNPSSGIDDVADQFTDITSQEHNITSGFEANLDTFNNAVDLQDYDFLSGISNASQYFKLQLENVFNVSSFVRAFWIIPVICVVLLRLLGG